MKNVMMIIKSVTMKNEHNKNEAKNESVETSCSGDSDTVTDNDDG